MFNLLKELWGAWTDFLAKSQSSSGGETNIDNSFDDNADHSPSINPANGMPMLPGGAIDVLGNPYGMDSSEDTMSSDNSDIFSDSNIGIGGSGMFDDHNSLFGDDHFSSFSDDSFHDPF